MANNDDIMQSMQMASEMSRAISENLRHANNELRGYGQTMSQVMSEVSEEMDGVFATSKKTGFIRSFFTSLGSEFTKLAKKIANARTEQVAFAGALTGFAGGFSAVRIALKAFGGLLKTTFSVGANVIGAFTQTIGKFFSFFWNALNASGGDNGLFEAIQELKEKFGALTDFTNQAVLRTAAKLRELPRNLKGVGILLKDVLENAAKYAETLGPLYIQFEREMNGASELFRAGLGLTDETFRQLVTDSRAMGRRFNDVALDIARNAGAIGEAVGVSQKVIAREMMKARTSIKFFGDSTDEQIGLAIGRFQSLGLEIENVTGMLEVFNTFESAAEAASTVASAFGVQLDVFRLVNEENPAAALDEVRRAFFAAGKSAESMSRHELQVLSKSLGFADERMARLALSSHNAGMSMEEIEQAAEASGEKTKSLEEVLQDLIEAIALTRLQGESLNGFFDAMNKGITLGITRFLRYSGVLYTYRRALRATYWGFAELTRAVLDAIPGLDKITDALKELWDPEFIRSRIGEFKEALVGLFTSGGRDFDSFAGKIKEIFGKIFDKGGPIVGDFISGGTMVMTTLGNIIKEGITYISEYIFGDPVNGLGAKILTGFRDALRYLANFMKRDNFEAALEQGGDFAANFGGGILGPVVEFFRSPEGYQLVKDIFIAIGDIIMSSMSTLNSYFKDLTGYISDQFFGGMLTDAEGNGPGIINTILITLFAPTVIGAGVGLITKAGASVFTMFVEGMMSRRATSQITSALTNAVTSAASGVASNPNATRAVADAGSNIVANAAGRRGSGNLMNLDTLDFFDDTRNLQRASNAAPAIEGANRAAFATAGAGRINPATIITGGLVLAALTLVIGGTGYQLIKLLNALPVEDPAALMMKATAFAAIIGSIGAVAIGMGLIGAIGQKAIPQIGIGGIIMGAIGLALGLGMPPLFRAIESITIDNFPKFLEKLAGIGLVSSGIAVLSGIMAGIGLAISSSGGTGLVAIAIGGAVMGAIAAVIVGGAYLLIDAINDMEVKDSTIRIIETLPDFFTSILPVVGAVGVLTGAAVISAFTSIITGEDSLTRGINALSEIMAGIKTSAISFINDINSSFGRMSESEILKIERGMSIVSSFFEIIGPNVRALSELVRQLNPGWFRSLFESAPKINESIESLQGFMESISGSLSIGINRISSGLVNIDENDIALVQALGPIFGVISSLIDNLPEIARAMNYVDQGYQEMPDVPDPSSVLDVTGVIAGIQMFMTAGIPELINNLISKISGPIFISPSAISIINAIPGLLNSTAEILKIFGSDEFATGTRTITQNSRTGGGSIETIEKADAEKIREIISSMQLYFDIIGPAIGELAISLNSSLSRIQNSEDFTSKIEAITGFISSVSGILSTAAELGDLGDMNIVSSMITQPMAMTIYSIINDLPSDSIIGTAVSKLDLIESSGIISKLENFFERSGGLFAKVRDNSVISLGEQQVANVARILPAVAAAMQTLERPLVVNDNLRIALNGTTFDITVILKVDAEELGRVAARQRLTQ
jgi:hypothetical protein